MLNDPKTLAEAVSNRYGQWAGNPNGSQFNAQNCAYEVFPHNGWVSYQCRRKPGHGPASLYCKQHSKKARTR